MTPALPRPPGKRHSLKLNDLFAVEFLSLMLLATLFSSANGLATTYLDILATERGIPNISLFFTAYAVALVFTKPLSGKLQDKKGLYAVMIPAVVFAALGSFFVGMAYSLGMMLLAAVCRAFWPGRRHALPPGSHGADPGRLQGGGGGFHHHHRPEPGQRPWPPLAAAFL